MDNLPWHPNNKNHSIDNTAVDTILPQVAYLFTGVVKFFFLSFNPLQFMVSMIREPGPVAGPKHPK